MHWIQPGIFRLYPVFFPNPWKDKILEWEQIEKFQKNYCFFVQNLVTYNIELFNL